MELRDRLYGRAVSYLFYGIRVQQLSNGPCIAFVTIRGFVVWKGK